MKSHKKSLENCIKPSLFFTTANQIVALANWKITSALLPICFLFAGQLFAQSLQKQNDSIFQILEKYIDSKDVDKMYSLVNPAFQQAVPLDKFKEASEKYLYPSGPFKYQFEGFEDGVNGYKLSGESNDLFMAIMVDKDSKISTLYFKGYPAVNQKQTNDSAFQLYLKNINEHDLNKMFAMLNAGHQTAVPLDTLRSIYQRIVFPLGTLQSRFESYFGGISRYTVYSSTDSLTMLIGVDNAGKIETFFIRPKKGAK